MAYNAAPFRAFARRSFASETRVFATRGVKRLGSVMSPSLPMVGEDFAGYRLRSVLGRGGMSVVFETENPRLGSVVALKVLAPELSEDDLFRERFLQESRVAASLNHPNVIPIYDTGPCDGLLYIAMRYVAGRDLRAVLKEQGHISPAQALTLLSQAGRALDAAHRHGLVHRDVKPANILIERGADDEPDHVYLADFGISKHARSRSGLTATGQLVGTIDYIAPEQIQGNSIDGRADIYSLGCVLYECLTGRVPFKKDLDAAVIWAHVEELPTAPSAVRNELPREIDDVIGRALAKDPNDRYPTAHEFITAARAALEAVPQASASTASEDGFPVSAPTVLTGASAPRSMPAPTGVGTGPPTSAELGESHATPPDDLEAPPSGMGDGKPADIAATALSPLDATARPEPQATRTSSEPAATPTPGDEPPVVQGTGPSIPTASPATGGPPTAGPPTAPPAAAGSPTVAPAVGVAATGEPPAGAPPAGAAPTGTPPPSRPAPPRKAGGRGRLYAAVLVALVVVAAVVVVLASGSSTPSGALSSAALGAVPTNHVTGSGQATIRLNGNQAVVTVTTSGLDSDAELVHLMHIHGGGKGECPPESAARLHNGHLAISTTDGINYYGPIIQALTTRGDSSVASDLAFPRYLTGGNLHYKRTLTFSPSVIEDLRNDNAVVVVHGIDYDGSGIYSGVLDPSELNKSLPGTATAPALCGKLIGATTAAAKPRSGRGTLVYTAALQQNAAINLLGEAFLCGIDEATPALPKIRREAGAGSAA